jgi:hypothetical protein
MELISPLLNLLPKEQLDTVLNQDYCELDNVFLGFVEIYEHLSQIIPTHFEVIDLGCYLAPQGYYFRNHKKYVGVDVTELKRFEFGNTEHHVKTIQDFIRCDLRIYELEKTFAICSYVPDENAKSLIRKTFKNLFIYYPCSENVFMEFMK